MREFTFFLIMSFAVFSFLIIAPKIVHGAQNQTYVPIKQPDTATDKNNLEAFNSLDANHDGTISSREFNAGKVYSSDAFDDIDENGDDSITTEEFNSWRQDNPDSDGNDDSRNNKSEERRDVIRRSDDTEEDRAHEADPINKRPIVSGPAMPGTKRQNKEESRDGNTNNNNNSDGNQDNSD